MDSVSIPLRAISQAITEFEFHMSPLEFIAAPHGRRDVRDEIEYPLCASFLLGQTPRAIDG
jgi:hypothetical protein